MHDWLLWQRIRHTAQVAPDRPAYIDVESNSTLTYAGLVTSVLAEPIVPDYRVLLQRPNELAFPIQMIANLLAGRAVYSLSSEASDAEITRASEATADVEPIGAAQGELLLSSSGTTGLPKIVRRSRDSLDHVARAMAEAIGFSESDRVIAAVPLSHSYGIEHGLLAPLWAGSTVLLCRGLNITQIANAIDGSATIFPAVPAMIELLAQSSTRAFDTHSLRTVYSAGAPLPILVANAFADRFGVRVGQVYGLTELGSVFYNDTRRDDPGSVGRPVAGVSVRIADINDPSRLEAASSDGEIAIRADSMLSGYVGQPLALADGYFLTGDFGHLSENGELNITGRVRLLIDVGGAKVNPLEVEDVLNRHPQVASSVVMPLKLSETIYKVRAIVVPADPSNLPEAADLRQWVRAELAAYKVPRVIEFRSTLPRSATGKILRHALEHA